MSIPEGFIEVTAIYDLRKACIRIDCIESVTDNAEEVRGDSIKLECRTIFYAGHSIDVTESYEDIVQMICAKKYE